MDIHLDLSHHCVETAIKRRRNKAISHYFTAPERQDLEDEIVLLGLALESFDFQRLRSDWTILAGHGEGVVTLRHGPDSQPMLAFDDVCVVPPATSA